MGESGGVYWKATGLMKISFIFNMTAMFTLMVACACGFAVSNHSGAAACCAIGILCLGAGAMLHFMLLYLPELEGNRGATLASAILCMIAGFFIIIALGVWGSQGQHGLGPAAANAATFGVLAAVFAIGGGIALILEFTGKYTLTAPPDNTPPANQM